MENNRFNAGAVQFDIINGNVDANLDTAFTLLEGLAGTGTDLAVLPEMFSSGFENECIGLHALRTPEVLERMRNFAVEHSMALAGSLPEAAEDGRVFNTLYFIDRDGQVKGAYRKLHLFRLTMEHESFTPGDKIVAADTSFGKVGLMVCYDLRFPELARRLFLDGVRLFIVSAQWPSSRVMHWQALIRARAIENQSYMICCNRTGADADLEFPGCSTIVGPLGEVLAKAGTDPCGITADVDIAAAEQAAELIPIKSDRRKDIYG